MDDLRKAVWMALLHSARWERYYGVLASRNQRLATLVRFVLLVSAMGAVTTLVAQAPSWAQVLFGGFVAGVVGLDFAKEPSRNAAIQAVIRDECGRSKLALDRLWRQLPQLDPAEAERRLDDLNEALHHITAKDSTAWDDKVNTSTTLAVFAEAKAGHVS